MFKKKSEVFSKSRNIFSKILKLAGIFIFIILFLFLPIYFYHLFDLKRVIIISSESGLKGITDLERSNLLTLDISKIGKILQDKNSAYFSINVVKQFPQTLLISPKKRIAVASIYSDTGKLYVDSQGILFSDKDILDNLPVINLNEISVYPDKKTDWKVFKAIDFILESEKKSIKIDQIVSDNKSSSFIATTENGIQVLLPFSGDMQVKASSLQLIVMRFRIEGKNINKIDFRFDKPIVTLTTGEKISSQLP